MHRNERGLGLACALQRKPDVRPARRIIGEGFETMIEQRLGRLIFSLEEADAGHERGLRALGRKPHRLAEVV